MEKTYPQKESKEVLNRADRRYFSPEAYIKKKENSQINNLTLCLEELEKEQTKPQVSRRKAIIKITVEINEMECRKTVEKMSESRRWFFEKINNIDKTLTNLIKKNKEQINKMINK